MLPLIGAIFCVCFFLFLSIRCFVTSDGFAEGILGGICCLALVIFLIVSLVIISPNVFCPECGVLLWTEPAYCVSCGYELFPHCDSCGEICRTAFCKLCGAEQ